MIAESLAALGTALGSEALTTFAGTKAVKAISAAAPIVSGAVSTLNKGSQSNAQNVQAGQVATNNPVAQFGNNVSSDALLKTGIAAAGLGAAGALGARVVNDVADKAKEGWNNFKNKWNGMIDNARAEVEQNDVSSDERLKEILKTEDPVDCFAQINSYVYKYTPEARSMYGDEAQGGTVNGDENFGVMAQELQKNPLTQAAVKEDENGYLMLDGGRLSSINTAMIAELCKKVQELEEAVYGRR